MMMVLIHDVVEIDAGDTYAYDAAGKATAHDREEKAAERGLELDKLTLAQQEEIYQQGRHDLEGKEPVKFISE